MTCSSTALQHNWRSEQSLDIVANSTSTQAPSARISHRQWLASCSPAQLPASYEGSFHCGVAAAVPAPVPACCSLQMWCVHVNHRLLLLLLPTPLPLLLRRSRLFVRCGECHTLGCCQRRRSGTGQIFQGWPFAAVVRHDVLESNLCGKV